MLQKLKTSLFFIPLVLVTGSLLVVVANLAWVRLETRPAHWDMARHLWTSLQYMNAAEARPADLLDVYLYYPPLIYLLVLPFYALFGASVVAAVLANNVFLLAGIVAVYGIGRKVGSRTAGLLAALLFATSPLISTQFKEFQIDGPLTCVTALALWALVSSPDFKSRRVAISFGVAAGLGLLCKWTFPGIIALPLLYCLALAIWHSWHERSLRRVLNIALAAVIAVAIAGFWYYTHRHQLKLDILANNAGAARREGDPTGLSFAALTYYVTNLVNTQLYLVPAGLFLVGVWRALTHRQTRLNLLLALVVGTYGFFSLVSNKDARYTLPFLPAVAVLAVYWIQYLPQKRQRIIQASILGYCLLTFWAMSFGIGFLPNEIGLSHNGSHMTLWGQHGYIIAAPSSENWHMDDMMREAKGSSLAYGGPDTIWFNSWDMEYYATKYKVQLIPATEAKYVAIRAKTSSEMEGRTVIKRYNLPDGTILTLYRKTP